MPNATFDSPDLTTFARLDELGLVAVGQRLFTAAILPHLNGQLDQAAVARLLRQ